MNTWDGALCSAGSVCEDNGRMKTGRRENRLLQELLLSDCVLLFKDKKNHFLLKIIVQKQDMENLVF